MDNVKPNYIACKIDISGYFTHNEQGKELLARCGGKIFYSGFFDDSVNTHCCSFTPMVYVEVIDLLPEEVSDEDQETGALWEELMELRTADDSGYYKRREIERMKTASPDHFEVLDCTFDAEDTEEERLDAVRDGLHGNPVF